MNGAERCEIVIAHEVSCRLDHGLPVQRLKNGPGILTVEGRTGGSIVDPVKINLALDIDTGMKGGIGLFHHLDGNIAGQQAVEAFMEV